MSDRLPPTRPSATPKDDPRRRELRREQAAAEAMQPLGRVPPNLADWKANHAFGGKPAPGGWWRMERGLTAVVGIEADHPHRARFYVHDLHGDRLAHLDYEGPVGMPDSVSCQRVLAAALAAELVTPLRRKKFPTNTEYEKAILDELADGKPHGMPQLFAAVLHLRRERGLNTPRTGSQDRVATAGHTLAAIERLRLRKAIRAYDAATYEKI